MIDTKELRRLAQAAMTGPDGVSLNWVKLLQDFQKEANPAAISELLDRLEAAESDALEQARLNGMGASREAALMAKLEAAERDRATFIMEIGNLCTKVEALREQLSKQRSLSQAAQHLAEVAQRRADALRAKIEQMERQEPVAWLHETRRDSDVVTDAVKHVWGKAVVGALAAYSIPLYPAPGAQPAPSVPEGWKLVPIEPTEKMINEGTCAATLPGPRYIDSACAKQCWEYMLAAAPEAKP